MLHKDHLSAWIAVAIFLAGATFALGQSSFFERTLTTTLKDPVILNVSLSQGNLRISYSREGQVVVTASGKDATGQSLPEEFFKTRLLIEQQENKITVRDTANPTTSAATPGSGHTIQYRIEVPFRTEVNSSISGQGNQLLIGITGPAKLTSSVGNIEATYIRFAPIQITTTKGNISCSRVFQVDAETGDGNITLMENGPSKAVVKGGRGRIEVGGARSRFEGSTDGGLLHIKAGLFDNWQLNSVSGNIHIELPPKASFDLDAATTSGVVSINRQEMKEQGPEARQVREQVNGGGKTIAARSTKGNIFVE